MKTLLFLLLSSVCLAETRPPEVWLYQRYNSFMWIIQKEPVDMPDTWHFSCARADIMFMDDDNAFKYLTFNWLDPQQGHINLNFFAVLAKGWSKHEGTVKPPVDPTEPVVEPNSIDPVFIVYFTASGTKYHTKEHYDTAVPISIVEAINLGLEPCAICKPMLYKGE